MYVNIVYAFANEMCPREFRTMFNPHLFVCGYLNEGSFSNAH